MFWMRNEDNSFTIHTLIWRPETRLDPDQMACDVYAG